MQHVSVYMSLETEPEPAEPLWDICDPSQVTKEIAQSSSNRRKVRVLCLIQFPEK